MSSYKINFNEIPWNEGREGVPINTYCNARKQIRLVEFETSDGFEQWCETGHIGYVHEGGLESDFSGELVSYKKGDGLFIPDGEASKHRGASIIPGTSLLMTEDFPG